MANLVNPPNKEKLRNVSKESSTSTSTSSSTSTSTVPKKDNLFPIPRRPGTSGTELNLRVQKEKAHALFQQAQRAEIAHRARRRASFAREDVRAAKEHFALASRSLVAGTVCAARALWSVPSLLRERKERVRRGRAQRGREKEEEKRAKQEEKERRRVEDEEAKRAVELNVASASASRRMTRVAEEINDVSRRGSRGDELNVSKRSSRADVLSNVSRKMSRADELANVSR